MQVTELPDFNQLEYSIRIFLIYGAHDHAGVEINMGLLPQVAVLDLIDNVPRAEIAALTNDPGQLDIKPILLRRGFGAIDSILQRFLNLLTRLWWTYSFPQRSIIALAIFRRDRAGQCFHLRAQRFSHFWRRVLFRSEE